MKCPNCGTNISNDTKFCPNCGKALESVKVSSKSNINSKNIFDMFLAKPKIVFLVFIVIILIIAFMLVGGNNSDQDFSESRGYIVNIFGVSFQIPEEFKESYHSGPFSSGETVDFDSGDYDNLEITVSPYYNVNLNSNHVKVKYSKNIDGVDGTLVFYDSNRISFYYKYGDYLVKLNSNSPDYEELFAFVIV